MMDGEADITDDQSSGWLEVRKKHRMSSKLSTQKVCGGSSNIGHQFSDPNQDSSNQVLKICTNQTVATLKGTTDLNSSVNTSSLLSEEAGQTLEHLDYTLNAKNSTVELSFAFFSDTIDEVFTGKCSEACKISTEHKRITDADSKDDICNLKVTDVFTSVQKGVPNDLISIELISEKSSKIPVGRNLTGDASLENLGCGDNDHSEGKERFRERLWCFLFENLNRAVDELYLLCELECDMGQMTEAILVLEEAIADIRELRCRVEHFEGAKRYAVQSSKDIPITNLKTDHRRPHALSWEVRRMTTSPRRAEILSSSVEAFRKIQMERAGKHIDHEVKDPLIPCSTIQNYTKDSYGTIDKRHLDGRCSESCRRIEEIHGNSDKDTNNLEKELVSASGKCKKELLETILECDHASFKDELQQSNLLIDNLHICSDMIQTNIISLGIKEKEKDKKNTAPWRNSMDAWKEKRNWEDILKSPLRSSSRVSCSPTVGRKSADRADRAKVLHDKLMSPEKKKKNALDTRKEAEERHARAMRIRGQLESERLQKLQRVSEKLNRVSEWQFFRNVKLREGLNARQQRGESRHEAYLARVARRAGDESSKVNEVRFITSLTEENKKLILRQKLHDSELRRAEKMQIIKIKQKEDIAKEEAAMERRKLLEAEKLQRLAEMQKKKEEAQQRKEEERKASSAAREAKAVEQLRRKEIRAKTQLEEAELLAQKLAEKLSESEQRRKFYLEQIREKAAMDFRDQSSPLLRRSINREGPIRHIFTTYAEDNQVSSVPVVGVSLSGSPYALQQPLMKKRIKRIRQRLMALKHDFVEPPIFSESSVVGYKALIGSSRAKIGKWVQELQRIRQARKKGTSSFELIVSDMIKFLEGKDFELQVSRQAGLLDFISSALPASHMSKPGSCQITVYLLRLLRVVLSVPSNRAYFLALNLLSPIIPMLSASLDSYIKSTASSNKMPTENMDMITEILDSFLFIITAVMGHMTHDEKHIQMQDELLELIVSYQTIHHFRDLFALYDRPQVEGSPFPLSIMLSLNLLSVLTSRLCSNSSIDWEVGMSKFPLEKKEDSLTCDEVVDKFVMNDTFQSKNVDLNQMSKQQLDQEDQKITMDDHACKKKVVSKQAVTFLLTIVEETGLISLTSLLTAVLLQANSRLSSDQGTYVLPSNFEEVAIGVLKVLNNLACLDISLFQKMLSRSDLRMEFFHLMSFLLSHCTTKWKSAHDQIGLLLLESLLLLGYFALFHTGNQAVLRWGKTPTILHKVCDLPFVFFSDPELTPILAGVFVAACYGCEQNRGVIQQEISISMLLTLLKSCRQNSLNTSSADNNTSNTSPDANLSVSEVKRSNGDGSTRPQRKGGLRNFSVRGGHNCTKGTKDRVQKDNSVARACDEWAFRHNLPALEASYAFMLHRGFPACLLDKALDFFSAETSEFSA